VLLRGRTATSLLFLLFGTALGVWTSRIPSVKSHLDLSDGLLSLALLAFAAGAIAGMLGLGRLADRWGSTRVMVPAACSCPLALRHCVHRTETAMPPPPGAPPMAREPLHSPPVGQAADPAPHTREWYEALPRSFTAQ
jgi:hypothetical protein